jgi:fluoride exporter
MNFLIVFIGGGVGSVARFALSSLVGKYAGTNFPWGTLAVNLIGAFCIGLVVEALALKTNAPPQLRLLLVTGLLGGFTTFSAFSLENALMFERGDYLTLGLYVTASVVGTLIAVCAGMYVLRNA